jgi:magnesium-transporting ATPase (P-type)
VQLDRWPKASPNLAFTQRAPLEVLKHCHSILQDDKVQELTHEAWDQVVKANDDLARQGFRVLGLAARQGSQDLLDLKAQDLEQNLIFIGLVAMFDPPRPEVKAAIADCHKAGIKVTMVTGDYGLTAEAIARNIGLVSDPVRVVTGEAMGRLSDAQLQQIVKYRSGLVFARTYHGYDFAALQAIAPTILARTGDPTVTFIYAQATTMTLAIIVACQDGNVFACRSEQTSIFRLGFFSNPFIWLGITTEWMLIIAIIKIAPLRQVFSTAPLTLWQWLLLLCCPVIVLGAEELRKLFLRKQQRVSHR